MAGKKGMRDRLLSPHAAEHIRSKIKTSVLIDMLTTVAAEGTYKGKEVDSSRIKAAEILLRKALPDLTATELSGGVTTYRDTLSRIAELAGWAKAASEVAKEKQENASEPTQPIDSIEHAQYQEDGTGAGEVDRG